MLKWGRNYKIVFKIGHRTSDLINYVIEEVVEVSYPISIKLQTSAGINYSNCGQCSLQLLNLSEYIQKKLWKDNYDNHKFILMELSAGYNEIIPLIYTGFITQCYSYRESGGVDYITEIQADNNSLLNYSGFANHTFTKGTKFEDLLKVLLENIPDYQIGYITPNIKPLPRNKTFIGQTLDLLGREYGGYDIFIDNNSLNIIDSNEVVPGELLVITPESGLLGSPRRANLFLVIDIIFEPRIKLGQAIELQSESLIWFNQIYKVIAIEHIGTISPTESGTLITRITLSLGSDPLTELQKTTGNYYNGTATTGQWAKPVRGVISSSFGNRTQPTDGASTYHKGIDIAANENASVTAPANGKVYFTGGVGGYGNCIEIDHGVINGKRLTSLYGHLNTILVTNGQNVSQNQQIGLVGSTGTSTGPHLHFEIRENSIPINPINYIGNY